MRQHSWAPSQAKEPTLEAPLCVHTLRTTSFDHRSKRASYIHAHTPTHLHSRTPLAQTHARSHRTYTSLGSTPRLLQNSPFGNIEPPFSSPKGEASSASIIVAQRIYDRGTRNRDKLGEKEQEARSRGLEDYDVETRNGQSPPTGYFGKCMGEGGVILSNKPRER